MKRIIARGVVGAIAFSAALAASGPGSIAYASQAPVNINTLVAAQSEPGVQLIATTFSAKLAVPSAEPVTSALEALISSVDADVASGRISSDQMSTNNAIVTAIDENPLDYFKPGSDTRTKDAQIQMVGTGWVVTPDGYMVTAAHVVAPADAELKDAFAKDALDSFNKQDAQEMLTDPGNFSTDQLVKVADASAKFNAHYLKISNVKREVSAQLGVAVTGLGKATKGTVANVIDVGESFPGKDVAILKIDGQSNLPTIPVGNDADVTQGDSLYITGYPYASTFAAGLSADSEVQPSVTEGPLSAKRTSKAGVPIIQTQAPASPGNSGGPVLDAAGKSIGILVAGALDDNGLAVAGQEFVIPISVVNEKLNEHNIHPTQSLTTKTYNQGLNGFYRHNYKQALKSFQAAQALYPGHPFAARFISDSLTSIAQGKDLTPAKTFPTVLVAAGAAVLLAVGVGVAVGLKKRSNRAKGQTPGPWSPDAWSAALPSTPPSPPAPVAPARQLLLVGAHGPVAPASSLPSTPPADWYSDPQRPDGLRYWDGFAWTNHTAS